MSKLSPALKSAINASWAKPNTAPAPKNIRAIYEAIAKDAASKDVGLQPWLAIAVCSRL